MPSSMWGGGHYEEPTGFAPPWGIMETSRPASAKLTEVAGRSFVFFNPVGGRVMSSSAERAGRMVGGVWRRLAAGERMLQHWFARMGWPAPAAHGLVWICRLLVIAVVLWFSTIFALVLAALALLVLLPKLSPSADEDRPRWRYGNLGFGLYSRNGFRIDPHESSDER